MIEKEAEGLLRVERVESLLIVAGDIGGKEGEHRFLHIRGAADWQARSA